MVQRPFSKHPFRAVVLVILGVLLVSVAPANRITTVPLPVTSPSTSPTPVRTSNSEPKQPNPLKRFFSRVGDVLTRPFRRRVPVIDDPAFVVLTSSSSSIRFCPLGQVSDASNCSHSRTVTLSAGFPAIQENKLLFTWSVTGGKLRGEGRKVTWDLSGLAEGTYTASVEVNDGNQHTSTASTKVEVAFCSDCEFRDFPCPTVWVVCPSGVESKQPTYFEANVAGGDVAAKPTYKWSLSAGKIISGQGTSKIMVAVSDLAGQSLTATVRVGGYDPVCKVGTVASCTTEVGQ